MRLSFGRRLVDPYNFGRSAQWRYTPEIFDAGVPRKSPAGQVCSRVGRDAVAPLLLQLLEDPGRFAAAHLLLTELYRRPFVTGLFTTDGDALVTHADLLEIRLEGFGLPAAHEGAPSAHSVDLRTNGRRSFNVAQLPSIRDRWHGRLDTEMLTVSPWIVLTGCVVVFAVSSYRAATWWRRVRLPHMCAACGYDLRATPHRCPECGAVAAKGIG